MRKVIYGAACSLDGYITGPGGEIDWLHFSADVQSYMKSFWSRVDTILMGRKTYEFAAAQGSGGSMPGIRATYVFSRTLTHVPGKNVHLVRENAGDVVRSLRAGTGKDICLMGGGDLAQSLFAEDVIDEFGLNVHPVLLGGGAPLFRDPGKRVQANLLESRVLDGGCLLARYAVRRSQAS
jgi:dihydrofolate reductase